MRNKCERETSSPQSNSSSATVDSLSNAAFSPINLNLISNTNSALRLEERRLLNNVALPNASTNQNSSQQILNAHQKLNNSNSLTNKNPVHLAVANLLNQYTDQTKFDLNSNPFYSTWRCNLNALNSDNQFDHDTIRNTQQQHSFHDNFSLFNNGNLNGNQNNQINTSSNEHTNNLDLSNDLNSAINPLLAQQQQQQQASTTASTNSTSSLTSYSQLINDHIYQFISQHPQSFYNLINTSNTSNTSSNTSFGLSKGHFASNLQLYSTNLSKLSQLSELKADNLKNANSQKLFQDSYQDATSNSPIDNKPSLLNSPLNNGFV